MLQKNRLLCCRYRRLETQWLVFKRRDILGLVFVIFMVQCSSGGRSSSSNQARPADSLRCERLRCIGFCADNVNARLKDSDSAQFRNQFIGRKARVAAELTRNSFGWLYRYKRFFVASGGGLACWKTIWRPDKFEETGDSYAANRLI